MEEKNSIRTESRATRQTDTIKILAEVASMVALSGALNLIKIFLLPQGGSVTLAAMVPILLLALRRGARVGTVAGVVLGLVVLVEEPFIVHPIQVLLDYPLAYGGLGIAGLFQRDHWERLSRSTGRFSRMVWEILPILGVITAITARFTSHVVSGVVYFANYALPGQTALEYSILYNGSYLLPELIISTILTFSLSRLGVLERFR